MAKRVSRAADGLTAYDSACGKSIDAGFAAFQGMDQPVSNWLVFAALVHRRTGGRDDGSHNPLSVTGAGWTGYVGLADDRGGSYPITDRTLFATVGDGCRAAALSLQFREYQGVQVAYRTGDASQLAESLQASPLRAVTELEGLIDDVRELLVSQRRPALASSAWAVAGVVAGVIKRLTLAIPPRRSDRMLRLRARAPD